MIVPTDTPNRQSVSIADKPVVATAKHKIKNPKRTIANSMATLRRISCVAKPPIQDIENQLFVL